MRLIRERIGDKYGEKNYKKRRPFKHNIPTIISFLLSSLFCVDFNAVFAHLGFEKRQIIYADQCNENYDDTNALKYYEIIGEGDSQYAPYANLACARIHNDLGHYNRALGFYKKQLSVMI